MIWAVILLATILVVILFALHRKPSGLPPGEWGWPVVGAMTWGNESFFDLVSKYKKKHGDIFSWKLGSRTLVVLCDFNTIKKAYNNPALSDRPGFYSFDSYSNVKRMGITNANGLAWQKLRRFVMHNLHNLGIGKTSLDEAIQFEAQCFLKDIEKRISEPTEIPSSMDTATFNIIWQLVASKRFDVDDKEFHELGKQMEKLSMDFEGLVTYFDFFPWMIPIMPHFVLRKLRITDYLKGGELLRQTVQATVDEHKATLDEYNPRDLIDHFLIHMKNSEVKPENTFSEEDLVMVLADFFTAGIETTAATLRWAFLYLAKYPKVQKKAQEEIDQYLAKDSVPSTADRARLCYMSAVICELQRLASVAPMTLHHQASEDTMINEYRIPKGTVLLADAIGCHFDPKYWEKPYEFYPEHFLTPEGKLITKMDGYLPFSVGRRVCPLASLALNEQFIFLTSFLQKFSVALPEGMDCNLEKNTLQTFANMPQYHKLVITKRD